jgi:hypothetical protein
LWSTDAVVEIAAPLTPIDADCEHAGVAKLATPLLISPAFEDRDALWRMIRTHSPYPLMAALAGYGELLGDDVAPWFRSNWALDGQAVDAETMALLHHEPFVDATMRVFDAAVVRPVTLLTNINGPMAAGVAHVDTPTFRGLKRSEVPVWLLVVMGASGLFERWSVRVAGALTWFYDRDDGEYEYWPHGREHGSECIRGPFGNVALVSDNDLMPHRVGTIGDAQSFSARVRVTQHSTIVSTDDGDWEITNPDAPPQRVPAEDVRVSILWKALTFSDERAARVYDDHEDDLELATIVDLLRADLRERGHVVGEPSDPYRDPEWSRVLTSVYSLTP